RALAGDPEHNVPLRPHDRLFVKRIPDWGAIKYVTLTGEFKFPGRYAIHKGERLSSVIERAGGYLPTAYLRGAYFTRESVRALQQKSLEEMTRRLERELLSEASARIGSSLTPEEVQSKAQEIQFKQRLIDFMRGLKATGRMSITLTNLRLFKGSIYDIELEDGDTLHLPQKNNVVNVVGAVMAETSHVFNEKWSYLDYINASGGMSRYADEANIFVLKVDGSARKLSGGLFDWNKHKERWELAGYSEELPRIEPGDVIVVPEKVTTIAWLREIRDITQILMNTAVTAATIIKLW
ncbi:MAG: SLBB domain-containing protein, partial [Syntrophales bacterium]|nr:SLBB domain-containing protein [Syntrophales bacterium]